MPSQPSSRSEAVRSALSAAFMICLCLFGAVTQGVVAAPVMAPTRALKAGVFEPARVAPDFTLRGSDGAALNLSHYRGKLVILGFGYTSCTDVCPITLAMLAEARKKLGVNAADVQVVYVTVDPERDNAARLKTYLGAFDPTFIGGTGTPEQLAAVRKDYGISAVKKAFDGGLQGYSVHHSSYIYLIDREGRLRGLMPFGHTADDVVHDANILLQK